MSLPIQIKEVFKRIVSTLLTLEAILVLKKYRPKIIAVTGNVGKTSTKDAIAFGLSRHLWVRKSEKSYNSDIGVPLSILNAQSGWGNPFAWLETLLRGVGLIIFRHAYPEWIVLEVGADRPGDIVRLTRWLKPDIAVFTRFAEIPIHVEFFDSPEELFKEKAALFRAIKPGGTAIVNADDERAEMLITLAGNRDIITYGQKKGATFRSTHPHILEREGKIPEGLSFKVEHGEEKYGVHIPDTLGDGVVYASLASLAVSSALKLSLSEIAKHFSLYQSPPGRLRLLAGNKDTVLIDDSYNSAPEAVHIALNALAKLKKPLRKIAVLGDITELGSFTIPAHEKLGQEAAGIVSVLILVGHRAKFYGEGAKKAGFKDDNIHWFREGNEAGNFLDSILTPGDTVLIKGSQIMRMEKVVEVVMAHPENKEKLLVRQEKEWRER
jgi:UDP-N-acetylmuramyl pentapeptide synthase